MATRGVSPGAALLRASRMFAMPAPISAPSSEVSAVANFRSDTATELHPTHLTLATPASSLSRGDWGLKRSLPLRSTTRTSTPLVRVKKMDTYEHITEFASASDHTLNLEKWQELNIPLTVPSPKANSALRYDYRDGSSKAKGVFEENVDITTKTGDPMVDELRWRFGGPWIGGQTDSEFNAYLTKEVRNRKKEFQGFLRQRRASEENKKAQIKASREGEPAPPSLSASDITEEQLRHYIQHLRDNIPTLNSLMREFLDLPPVAPAKAVEAMFLDSLESKARNSKPVEVNATERTSSSPYAVNGPPKTHPSAGLSYLRTRAHLYNHPTYGPQAKSPPVKARVIQPKTGAVGAYGARLGVAGVVVEVPYAFDSFKSRHSERTDANIHKLDTETPGGAKLDLEPVSASINPQGRIDLTVEAASKEAVAVRDGKVAEYLMAQPMTNMPRLRNMSGFSRSARPQGYRRGPVGGYGLEQEDGPDVFGERAKQTEEARWSKSHTPAKETANGPIAPFEELLTTLGEAKK